MLRKVFSLFLILAMLCSLLPSASAAQTRGVTLSSDSAFFSALNLSTMPNVQSAVNAGNYTLAKQELLSYYSEKFSHTEPQPGSEIKGAMVYLAAKNSMAFSEPYLNYVDVTATEYTKYTFNLAGYKTGNYVLSMLDKTAGEIIVASRENSAMSPQLVLGCTDGTSKTLTAIADSYVCAGTNADTNYGSATALYAHDDYSGTTPYGNNTKRIYLRFDATQFPSNAKSAHLVVYAKRSGTNAEPSLRLHVFGAYATTWTETNLTWTWLKSKNSLAHFSWNNMPGGMTWVAPDGVPSQFAAYNGRFYEVTSLVQTALKSTTSTANYNTYMTLAKDLMIDFINDAGAGTPQTGQDLEPANRLLEFPYIYKHLLAGGFITPDENIKLLSWVYDEANHLSDHSCLFSSSNAVLTDTAYYHGFRHLTGFYQACGFFSEFTASSKWRTNYAARQAIVVDALVMEDGAYSQVSFGYPSEMINCGVVLLAAMKEAGDNSTAYTVKTKLIKLAKYLVDCTQPDGKLPYWGQGAPSSTKPVVQTILNAIGDTMDGNATVAELRRFVAGMSSCALDTDAQFNISKIAVDRTGWTSNDTMFFMNAKCGGNHTHRDALSLLLYYQGRQLLTDTGMTSYDSTHPHFRWQNSTSRSHNTIEVDGKAQTIFQNLTDVTDMGHIDMTANNALTTVTAWSDANNKKTNTQSLSMDGVANTWVFHSTNFRHTRDVSLVKALGDILIVTDKIVPEDSSSHTYTQNWHSAPYSNATIASDGTGKTQFSSGPNLIIAQAGSTTASLQTGYDSTAASAPTKYFEYKQTKSGTVTYQTVLYPVSNGATATVKPTKLSMSNTSDATALAASIAITDSSKPELKTLYHYHSFEQTPSTRSFGSYTTNASTAMLSMNASNKISFTGLANGSALKDANGIILSASGALTDLAVSLDGTTLSIECTDPKAAFVQIKANLSAQTVDTVLLNGEETAFTQSSDGTVSLGGEYLLTHFEQGDYLAKTANWSTNLTTVSVDTTNGLLSGTISGHDPYVYTKTVPAYEIKSSDVVELRIKTSITSGDYTALQFFYMTDSDTGFSAQKCLSHSASSYPADEYVTIRLTFPASVAGQTLTGLRIDMVGSNKTNPAKGSYTVDYIYIGTPDTAPSNYEAPIFFDFTNTSEDRLRYTSKTYGDRNYDTGFWSVNTARCSKPAFDGENMIIEIAETTDNYSATGVAPFLQTSNASLLSANDALDYTPNPNDYVQIRFTMQNCAVATANPAVRLYFSTDASGSMKGSITKNIPLANLTNGEAITITVPFAEAAGYTSATRVRGLRLNFPNVCSARGKTGIIAIDYIYVGSRSNLPNCSHIEVIDDAVAATCTETGLTEGKHCSVCNEVIVAQEEVAALGHTEVIDEAVAATCTSYGKTEGMHCSVCNETLVAQEMISPLDHVPIYTDNGDKTHTVGCENCDYNEIVNCVFENGECICGAKEVLAPIYDDAVKFSHSLTLENDISINFIGLGSALSVYDSFYLECKVPVYNGNELVDYEIVNIDPVYNGKNYECTLLGVTAKMMNDNIEAVFRMTKDGQEYYSKTDVYSVAEYAYGKLDSTKATDTAELKTVCANLLRYGALAQIQFNYRTDALVDTDMTVTHKSYLTDLSKVEMNSYMNQLSDLPNFTVPWKSATLELGNKVIMCLIANLSSYNGDPSELTMRLSYIDSKGQNITVDRPLKLYDEAKMLYAVSYDGLRATEMRSIVSAAIYLNGTRVSKTVEYSIESYGGRNPSDLCRAMLAYGDSANAFFAN